MGTDFAGANLRDPVTAHMHQDFTRVLLGQTVGETLDGLRSIRRPDGSSISTWWTSKADCKAWCHAPVDLSAAQARLADIMVRRIVALPAEATVEDACEFFIQHRLLSLPIVDSEKRLLGVVDVELYTDELGQLGEAGTRGICSACSACG